MSAVVDFVKFIETYRGRDKLLRISGYVAMFIGGQGTSPFSEKVRLFGREMSACRVVLRLFDDLPMLVYNLKYGLGSKEKNGYLRILDLGSNLVNQLYYPVEHIAWCADRKMIGVESSKFWVAGIMLWASSLFFEILKCFLRIMRLRHSLAKLKKRKYLEKQEDLYENSEQREALNIQIESVSSELIGQYLLIVQSGADLLNAGNWMPKGVLWSGRFSPTKCGLFGLISSLIMVYRQWPAQTS